MRATGKARHGNAARLCLVLLALFAAPSAHAYTPPDLWRIVEARPRPWNPTPPTDAARALVGSGLAVLEDGTVKGPAPLACAAAHVRDLAVPWPDIFAGQVSTADLPRTLSDLHMGGDAVVIRVACGATVFDYYMAKDSRVLLFADTLLILRKPMEEIEAKDLDEWVQPFRPGFDCKDAKATAERLACADFFLARADRAMVERYNALRASHSEASFATIRETQRGWLALTRARCNAAGRMPEEWADRRDIANCLREATDDQADILAAAPLTAGGLRLEMRLHGLFRRTPPREDIIAYPWLSGTPAPVADAFNRMIAERFRPTAANADLARGGTEYDGFTFARRDYGVSLFNDRLLGLTFSTLLYSGGAHEGHGASALLFDLRAGRVLTLAELFRPNVDWRKAITAYCLEQLRADQPDGEYAADSVAAVVGKATSWRFGPQSATVYFDVYTIASYAAGPSEVEIPYAELRKYLRPDAPLPQP